MSRILITSALPYINGIKHLGNLVGSMLPADVYARFKRAQGEDVLFIGERLLADPAHALAAHMAHGIRLHGIAQHGHAVTADAGQRP